MYLYAGVEAIVFAATGAIFGTTVQRARVEAAERKESEAHEKAAQAASDAELGRTLESAVRAEAIGKPGPPPPRSDKIAGGPESAGLENAPDSIARLLRLADELRRRQGR